MGLRETVSRGVHLSQLYETVSRAVHLSQLYETCFDVDLPRFGQQNMFSLWHSEMMF